MNRNWSILFAHPFGSFIRSSCSFLIGGLLGVALLRQVVDLVQFGRLMLAWMQFGGRVVSLSVVDVLHVLAVVGGCRVSIVLADLVVSVLLLVVTVWLGMRLAVCVMSTIAAWHMRLTVSVMIWAVCF